MSLCDNCNDHLLSENTLYSQLAAKDEEIERAGDVIAAIKQDYNMLLSRADAAERERDYAIKMQMVENAGNAEACRQLLAVQARADRLAAALRRIADLPMGRETAFDMRDIAADALKEEKNG